MIDVNGTRFHLLLGRGDFGQRCRTAPPESGSQLEHVFQASTSGADAGFSWNPQQQVLTLGARVFSFKPAQRNVPVTLDDRRGAAFDIYGNVYWIAANGTEILVQSSSTGQTTHFWSSLDDPRDPGCLSVKPGGFTALPPGTTPSAIQCSGLAVTSLHYLVVGTLDPAGLVVFDLHRGGEPRQLLWPSGVLFEPFDFAAAPGGGVIVLDRRNRRLWALDQTLGVVSLSGVDPSVSLSSPFGPLDGSSGPKAPCRRGITLNLSFPLGIASPVAVESLADDSVLVLETDSGADFSFVHRFVRPAGSSALAPAGPPVSTELAAALIEQSRRAGFRLPGHDMVVASRSGQDLLYVAGTQGDQTFSFAITIEAGALVLTPLADVYPMRLFGGRGLVTGPGSIPNYDSGDLWVPLAILRGNRFVETGAFVVDPLDGKDPGCVWHRLMIDAALPPGCDIGVRTRASDNAAQLTFAEWQDEPRPRRRETGTELVWSADLRQRGIETFELLFQRAKGRYLQLEITLRGPGRCSPRIFAMRAWYPRFSYLERYLPAVYRENAESASFLDRFLANPEGFFTEIEDRIVDVQALLDYRTAPQDTLDWLASWFHVALDPAWDEPRRRLFIQHAAEFFEWRGTVPGLRMALRLATESCADESTFSLQPRTTERIRIIERFRTRPLPGVVFTAVDAADGLPLRATKATWDPTLGAADLNRRWRQLIGDAAATYPITAPADPARSAQWTAFSIAQLGFVPRSGDVSRWRTTLQRRYPTLDHLSRAWKTSYASWAAVPLPVVLPDAPAMLRDWIQFQSVVLPAYDSAHQFTVFVPQGTLGLPERDALIALIRRIVSLEKPAHTAFSVKFYWAFFRVGEARLGEGTVVDLGSRSPELLAPFVLDRHYLGSGYLGGEQPARSSSPCACGSSTRGELP
ncbi:MAG TPA: phage tail protein [Vicinamibacterales bacterium]|nr:phage tail protein [Vicinamibacterales bacterium]